METNDTQSRIDSLMSEYEKYYADLEKKSLENTYSENHRRPKFTSASEYLLMMQYEDQQLIKNGGLVRRKDDDVESCWKFMPTFMYVILAIFTIAMIFFSILQHVRYLYIFDYRIIYLNQSAYISLWLFYIAFILFFIGYLLIPVLENRDFRVEPANSKAPTVLGLGNFMGFSLVGNYRNIGDSVVAYYCLCIFVPIIPLGCYRVSRGETRWKTGQGYSTPYKIYGSEKWDGLEVLHLYINGIAGLLLGIGILGILGYLFS